MNEVALTQMIRARTALYIEHPMWGILALRLLLVEDETVKTLAVDHEHLYYNPDYILNELTPPQRKTAVAHEVSHIALGHLDRCGGRNPKKWNAAGDYRINADLKADGFELHQNWLFNATYANPDMSADHIYNLLPDDPNDPDNGDGRPEGGWGAQDEMKHGAPLTADQAAEIALDWKLAVSNAARIAESMGKLPGSMKRVVEELKGNKVDWTQQLRNFATEANENDFSWNKPQRRMLPYGHFLPSLYQESMGLLVNILDTSGSIDEYILNLFGTEIVAMWAAMTPERLINIYADAAVNHVDEYDAYTKPEFHAHGGGGTDFRPAFEYIEKNGLQPDCFIYLTDGYGTFPLKPPSYPVLWVMTTDVVAPFGTTIRIDT
jgi:predicted metal-dependent peptidase